jgi:hypothetical protein
MDDKWDEQVLRIGETVSMNKKTQHLIAEVPCRRSRVETMIGIDRTVTGRAIRSMPRNWPVMPGLIRRSYGRLHTVRWNNKKH